jgi:hypothetical protein
MTKLRDEYTAKMHLELQELNAKLDTLESKAHEAETEVREKYRSEMAKLRRQSRVAGDKLEQIKASGEDTWDKMVLDMNKVRTAFTQSVNYFKSQF